jgi:hypothetical protein
VVLVLADVDELVVDDPGIAVVGGVVGVGPVDVDVDTVCWVQAPAIRSSATAIRLIATEYDRAGDLRTVTVTS